MKLKNAIAGLVALGLAYTGSVQAKPVDIWISSFQDQLYYENMVKLYKETVDNEFEAKVQSFGFREMPEKLAVSVKTGINPPDVVQLDEVLFGAFLGGEVPFADLSGRIKRPSLKRTSQRAAKVCSPTRVKPMASRSRSARWCSTTVSICSRNWTSIRTR